MVVGSSSYTFGLFVVPVTDELGMSRATISNGYIALLLGVALLSPLVGRLLDKVSARLVILSGGVTYSGGLFALTLTDSNWLLLLIIFIPVAYGYTACGTLAINTVIVRWFRRRRGTALGIMAVSTSTGGFLMAPFTATMIENFDWRNALLINSAIVLLAITLMTLLLVRNRPLGSEAGFDREFQTSPENSSAAGQNPPNDEKNWTYRELITNRNFWLLTLAIGLMLFCDQAMVTAQVPYFQDIGIDLSAAALIISCMTASAICGKLLVGYLADRVDLRFVFIGIALAHIALQVLYILQPTYWVLLIFATLLGVAIGGVFPAWSTLLAWLFGTGSYGTVMGLMTIITKGMAIVGVRMVGEIYDAAGSYVPAFYVFICAAALSVLLALFLKPPIDERPLQ
ncbi:MAG: MFS transporter [Halieaceae bacterium]|nr:MFS transporter [Halieaceae bacterium]